MGIHPRGPFQRSGHSDYPDAGLSGVGVGGEDQHAFYLGGQLEMAFGRGTVDGRFGRTDMEDDEALRKDIKE